MVQDERGWVSEDAMEEVGRQLGCTPAYVKGVLSFYTMYHQHPVGKHFIQVCTTSPCNVCGAEDVVQAFLDTPAAASSASQRRRRFTVIEVECLGACGFATPVHDQRRLHRIVTPERSADRGGAGLMGYPHPSHPRETPVLSKYFGDPEARTLEGWRARGGYEALRARRWAWIPAIQTS
jgi:NADH:ubiquinone oxidoreductase subunit E